MEQNRSYLLICLQRLFYGLFSIIIIGFGLSAAASEFIGDLGDFPQVQTPTTYQQSFSQKAKTPSIYNARSLQPHRVHMLEYGVEALAIRLQMIAKARTSIELEYFIFNPDRSGRLVLQALLRKKQQNPQIQIRILLDASSTVLALKQNYAEVLAQHQIELRYYNPTPLALAVSTQYRNHRKLLIIDGQEAVTGGRNIADEYFDLSPEYNFVDRDIWIQGPMIQEIQQTFNAYWTSPHTKGSLSQFPTSAAKKREAQLTLVETEEDRWISQQVMELGQLSLQRDSGVQGQCRNLHFVSDEPGFAWGNNAASAKRNVRDALISAIEQIPSGEQADLESPYFIIKSTGQNVLERMLSKNIQANLLTNSLGSTDAFYVAAVFNASASGFAKLEGFKMHIYGGKPLPGTLYVQGRDGIALATKATWGTHAKTFIFGKDQFAVGTFNVDPRSANLNTEMAIFCSDTPDLTAVVRSYVHQRITQTQSHELGKDGRPIDGTHLLEGASSSKVMLYFLSMIPAKLFDFLL